MHLLPSCLAVVGPLLPLVCFALLALLGEYHRFVEFSVYLLQRILVSALLKSPFCLILWSSSKDNVCIINRDQQLYPTPPHSTLLESLPLLMTLKTSCWGSPSRILLQRQGILWFTALGISPCIYPLSVCSMIIEFMYTWMYFSL